VRGRSAVGISPTGRVWSRGGLRFSGTLWCIGAAAEACSTWGDGDDGQAFLYEAIRRVVECFCKSKH